MSDAEVLRHVVPQVGLQEITLYPPADYIYARLSEQQEVERLESLLHLGALSNVFPGTRQARWDYTLAMLYYVGKMQVAGMSSTFTIGEAEFSSGTAALQSIALLWNVGHLPGTFSVEKGVYRYLWGGRPEAPAEILWWPRDGDDWTDMMKWAADRSLKRGDYRVVARVLGVLKMLSFIEGASDDLGNIVRDFGAPFLIGIDTPRSSQWTKLRRAFRLVRHLAYLTLDAPFSGLNWAPGIPVFLEQTLASGSDDLAHIDAQVSEVLSPIERAIYESVYHRPEARRECAVVTACVTERLSSAAQPVGEIKQWLDCSSFEELGLTADNDPGELNRVANIRLRSHFLSFPEAPVELEEDLKHKGFTHASVFRYAAWNSDTLLEPDETIIDAMTLDAVTPNRVGRLILWTIGRFDDLNTSKDDVFAVLRKNDLESTYSSLLSRALQLKHEGLSFNLKAWPLREFGLLPEISMRENRGAIWASPARLDDPLTRHIVRDRSKRIPGRLRDQYEELLGIRKLRQCLRQEWTQKELRQRWLVISASVRFCSESERLIEFDGGLVKISTRSGRMTWYGLETKRGRHSPSHSLRRRAELLGLGGAIRELSPRHAALELHL
ncbi:MAG: hypothetical protein U9R72_07890 [Chloroflexota bacterium]|nr:hypothetical protein [Chloroflexota bacterium]